MVGMEFFVSKYLCKYSCCVSQVTHLIVLQHMIRFRYLPFTWGKPKFQVSCAQYLNIPIVLCLFPLCTSNTHIHILFYGRVRRLEKARRPFCNRVPDQLTSKKGSSCLADYPVIYQLSSCCLLSVSCDKLLPTSV